MQLKYLFQFVCGDEYVFHLDLLVCIHIFSSYHVLLITT